MIRHWKGAIAVLLTLAAVSAAIAGSGTITVKDSNGTVRTYDVVTDGSGNYIAMNVLCDYSAGANCATVNSSHQLSVVASNDPCMQSAKQNVPIDSNTTALTQLIAASGSTKIYVCSLLIVSNGTTITFNTGTGTNCGTSTAGLIGGTTVGNSMYLASLLTAGNGLGTIAVTGAGGEVCMALGTSVYVAGNMTYVQQ